MMETKHTKYWEQLLVEWRALGRDGLTIPYIIGSQQFLPSTNCVQTIESLLLDISTNKEYEVYITYCMNINEIILGIRDESKTKIAGHFPPLNGGKQQKLFLTNGVSNLGDNVESIIITLMEKYQEKIASEKFSKRGDEWGDYSTSEKEFIISCLKV
ncbi:MAG: hypothetical protein DYG99_12120 [Bacteroidetes bacterium CHB5]|nr:hypothetical protein [Bacteroidetes bacterium CHB5]